MAQRTLEKYLLSTCLFVIDEFNVQYKSMTARSPELKAETDLRYSEADLVVRLGYPFRQMANFSLKTSKGKEGEFNDIVVKDRDFRIEVKYIRNSKSGNKNKAISVHRNWDAIEEDIRWLIEEVRVGRKGKRAFVMGWFNSTDRFSEQMQLGKGGGRYPLINIERMKYFPFLGYNDVTCKMSTINYDYTCSYIPKSLPLPSLALLGLSVDCMFLGEPEDKFHFAIYY